MTAAFLHVLQDVPAAIGIVLHPLRWSQKSPFFSNKLWDLKEKHGKTIDLKRRIRDSTGEKGIGRIFFIPKSIAADHASNKKQSNQQTGETAKSRCITRIWLEKNRIELKLTTMGISE
jgi:hypothetical protein